MRSLAATKPDRKLFPQKYRGKKPINYSYNSLGDHHFFELLKWNPQKIKKAAVLWN